MSPFSFLFLVILIFTLDHLPTTFCQGDAQYVACPVRFRCANFPNLEYPFWGGGRDRHCGHPAFELDCGGDVPLITLQSRKYRVLGIDSRSLLITVARQDLWNNTCPSPINNTVLDYRLFRHPSGDQNLTLSYNCAGTIPGQPQSYRFDCTVGRSRSDSYFLTEAISSVSSNLAQLTCTDNIQVPINQTSAQLLSLPTSSEDDLQGVLKAGFGLIWEANDTNCNECGRSGGRCGYNASASSFACYCVDRPYPYRCNETDPGTDNFPFGA